MATVIGQANEDAGPRLVIWLIKQRPALEGLQLGFDFAKPAVDVFGKLLGLSILLLDLLLLGAQGLTAGIVIFTQLHAAPAMRRMPLSYPYGKLTATLIHFQPSVASSAAAALSFSVTSSRSSDPRIPKPATIVLVERIAHDDAAGCFIGLGAHEPRASVGRFHRVFGQHTSEIVGMRASSI